MCIGVPGQVLAVGEDIHQLAQVEVCGIKRDVNIALICEGDTAELVGQWVLVHVGFAMSIIDEDEAKATLDALRRKEIASAPYLVACCHIPLFDENPKANPGDVARSTVDAATEALHEDVDETVAAASGIDDIV